MKETQIPQVMLCRDPERKEKAYPCGLESPVSKAKEISNISSVFI